MQKIVTIIGGGISGLVIAWHLSKYNIKTIIIEKENELGGLAAPFQISGGFLEKSYHLTFKGDSETINLCKELGVKIHWKKTKIGIYEDKKVYDVSTVFDILFNFKPLTLFERILFLKAVLKISRIKEWKKIDGLDFKTWAIKETNRNVFNKLWKPLIDKKFYEQANNISLAWFWGKTAHRAKSRSRLFFLPFLPNPFALEEFGYIKGSFKKLYERLAESTTTSGGRIIKNCAVEKISIKDNKIEKIKYGGGWHKIDFLVSTIPYESLLDLIEDKEDNQELFQEIERRKYVGAIGLIFSYPTSISNECWLNVNDTEIPFIVSIEITNLVSITEFNRNSVMYLYSYLLYGDKQFSYDDQELFKFYCKHFKKIYPHFDVNKVLEYKVIRWKYADPFPKTNFGEKLPPLKSKLKNFFMCDFTKVYPYDKGSNKAISIAKKVGNMVLSDINSSIRDKI